MSRTEIEIGFVPLVDAAVLVVAKEMGFAAEEGLALKLTREPSWSNIRDKMALGLYPCAQMLAPMPLAMTLGAGAMSAKIVAPFVLGVGGDTFGVSRKLSGKLWGEETPPWGDAHAVGRALLRVAESQPLRIGVPFPFSMHLELMRYWLEGCGGAPDRDVSFQTVPPPIMADALAAGQIDAFCVGEPWGSAAVEQGTAILVLPTSAIWAFAPEKVLGVRSDWASDNAGVLAARPKNVTSVAELLAQAPYLNQPALLIERGLSGALVISPSGELRRNLRFMAFNSPEASFPWRSQALWIAARSAFRWGVEPAQAREAALTCYRPDLFRAALEPLSIDLPGASSKVEGALESRTGVASARGELFLGPDWFFDGCTFDPETFAPSS